jgi:hypothetical protein
VFDRSDTYYIWYIIYPEIATPEQTRTCTDEPVGFPTFLLCMGLFCEKSYNPVHII